MDKCVLNELCTESDPNRIEKLVADLHTDQYYGYFRTFVHSVYTWLLDNNIDTDVINNFTECILTIDDEFSRRGYLRAADYVCTYGSLYNQSRYLRASIIWLIWLYADMTADRTASDYEDFEKYSIIDHGEMAAFELNYNMQYLNSKLPKGSKKYFRHYEDATRAVVEAVLKLFKEDKETINVLRYQILKDCLGKRA
jgi:hypothetical protein